MEDSISFANNYENFLQLMELKGYEIRRQSGEAYLKPMGEKRFIRLTDIPGYYTKEAIESQIEKGIRHEVKRSGKRIPRIIGCRKNYRKYMPPTSYQKAFLAKMYRTGQLKAAGKTAAATEKLAERAVAFVKEAENEEIVDIVRGMSISLEELPLVLQRIKVGDALGQNVPKSAGPEKEDAE